MNKFDELKAAAENKVKEDEAAISTWLTRYRWVLYIACGAIGFILAKLF